MTDPRSHIELSGYSAPSVSTITIHEHRLELHSEGELRPALYGASLEQDCVRQAPAVFVIAAVYERTERKYGHERGPRYVCLEAGQATQNMLLQVITLGLGGVPVGAFHEMAKCKRLFPCPANASRFI